jgi:hypothetical protein
MIFGMPSYSAATGTEGEIGLVASASIRSSMT